MRVLLVILLAVIGSNAHAADLNARRCRGKSYMSRDSWGFGADAMDAGTDTAFAFSGAASVTIPAGQAVWSDPFHFALAPQTRLAVTIGFGAVPAGITGHPGSRTTSYLRAATRPRLLVCPRGHDRSLVLHQRHRRGGARRRAPPSSRWAIRSPTGAGRRPTATTAGPTTWRAASRRMRARQASRCSIRASAATPS